MKETKEKKGRYTDEYALACILTRALLTIPQSLAPFHLSFPPLLSTSPFPLSFPPLLSLPGSVEDEERESPGEEKTRIAAVTFSEITPKKSNAARTIYVQPSLESLDESVNLMDDNLPDLSLTRCVGASMRRGISCFFIPSIYCMASIVDTKLAVHVCHVCHSLIDSCLILFNTHFPISPIGHSTLAPRPSLSREVSFDENRLSRELSLDQSEKRISRETSLDQSEKRVSRETSLDQSSTTGTESFFPLNDTPKSPTMVSLNFSALEKRRRDWR